jgi:hypothetical protein
MTEHPTDHVHNPDLRTLRVVLGRRFVGIATFT